MVPAIAVAAARDHPDRELIELGRKYAELVLKEKEVFAHFNRSNDLNTNAEWDRWQAECGALTGCSEAEQAAEALADAMSEIEEAVLTIAAKTVAEVRAAVMKRIFRDADEEYTDARLVRAMIRDIEAKSQRAPVA